MERVLAERHKRAEGAQVEAEASRAAVQEKLRVYNGHCEARAGKYLPSRKCSAGAPWTSARPPSPARARPRSSALQAAKKASPRKWKPRALQLEQSKDNLANEIAEAILAGGPSGPVRGTGAR